MDVGFQSPQTINSDSAPRYDPIIEQDFTTTILDLIYGTTGFPGLDTLHSHRLSVFFILLANGMVFDSHPSSPNLGRQYHALARAALSLDSILLEATCATVQALFLMFRFIYNADRSCNEERWLLTGLSARLSQTVSLIQRPQRTVLIFLWCPLDWTS